MRDFSRGENFLKDLLYLFMREGVCAPQECMPRRPEALDSMELALQVVVSCLTWVCKQLDAGPLEEQLVLFTAKPLPRPQTGRFKNFVKWGTSLGRGSAVTGSEHLTLQAPKSWNLGSSRCFRESGLVRSFKRVDKDSS